MRKLHFMMFGIESLIISLLLLYPVFRNLPPIYKPISDKPAVLTFKFASGQDALLRKIKRSALLYITKEKTGLDETRSILLDHEKYKSGQSVAVKIPFPISGFRLDFRMEDQSLDYPVLTSVQFGETDIPVDQLERPYYTVNPFPCYFYRPHYFVKGNETAYAYTSLAAAIAVFFLLVWLSRKGCLR